MSNIPVVFIKNDDMHTDRWLINDKEVVLTFLTGKTKDNIYDIVNQIYNELKKGKVTTKMIENINYKNVLKICFKSFNTELVEIINNEIKRMICLKKPFKGTVYTFMSRFFDTGTIPPYEYKKYFIDVIDEANQKIYQEIIKEVFEEKSTFLKYISDINIAELIEIIIKDYKVQCIEYVNYKCKEFTENREIITLGSLKGRTFFKCKMYSIKNKEFNQILCDSVAKEYQIQKEVFQKTNSKEFANINNICTLYSVEGVTILKKTFDFNLIIPIQLRKEVKAYIEWSVQYKNPYIENTLDLVVPILKIITERFVDVGCFNDIKQGYIDDAIIILETTPLSISKKNGIEKIYSPSSLRKMVQSCSKIIRFLQENLVEGCVKPKYNYFSNYSFPNSKGMEKRTDIIPEKIFDEIDKYSNELSEDIKLIYEIFKNTGLRAKEVLFLQENCIRECGEDNLVIVRYLPYKILKQIKSKGLLEVNDMIIPRHIGELILKQQDKTKKLREKYLTPFIFIVETGNGTKANIRSDTGVRIMINKIISDHNIVDEDGVLWNFTTRQFRKTIVSIMIENNATPSEISYWLGQISKKTERDYYEDATKSKLAKLNTKFFEEKFNVILDKNEYENFTEEERSCLYIDFAIGYRQVELGYCIKKISDGPCGRDIGGMICSNCSKLCTGEKYLKEWIKLRDSAKKIVDELIVLYEKNNIENYENFREYQQEVFYLKSYERVIEKIVGKQEERHG